MSSKGAQPIRLVLVESHRYLRERIHLLLDTDESFAVIAECASGVQAVSEALRLQPDVILTDLRLDDSNGLALARMVNELMLSIPVVLMSSAPLYEQAILSCNISAVVLKDELCLNLIPALNGVCAKSSVDATEVNAIHED